MYKIAFGTLGCKLNQYETDCLVSSFRKSNYEIVSINDFADIYVINTCTVTGKSDAKSRRMIYKVKRQNQDSIIVVTGCLAETDFEYCKSIPEVSIVVGNENKYELQNIIERYLNDSIMTQDELISNPFGYKVASETLHTRSYLKIQDGCDYYCSYCKVPFARGKPVSRPFNDILENAKELINLGYHEIILTGINIAEYHDKHINFVSLLGQLIKLEGNFRLNITSIEPNLINDKLLDLLSSDKIVFHLHLPLQSGSDKILILMFRKYSNMQFKNSIDKIYSKYPGINLTSDVIVGFPGETEEDFMETVDLIKYSRFSHIHTFKYSIREGTRAADYSAHVEEYLKTQRSEHIRNLSDQQKKVYMSSLLNKNSKFLVEKIFNGQQAVGHTTEYVKTKVITNELKVNDFREITYTGIENDSMIGKLI